MRLVTLVYSGLQSAADRGSYVARGISGGQTYALHKGLSRGPQMADPWIDNRAPVCSASGGDPVSVRWGESVESLSAKEEGTLGVDWVDLPDIRHYDHGCAGDWSE